MHVSKLRPDADRWVPAGRYFAQLAQQLEDANEREADLREHLDEEDRRLERRYRRRTAVPQAAPMEHGAAAH